MATVKCHIITYYLFFCAAITFLLCCIYTGDIFALAIYLPRRHYYDIITVIILSRYVTPHDGHPYATLEL